MLSAACSHAVRTGMQVHVKRERVFQRKSSRGARDSATPSTLAAARSRLRGLRSIALLAGLERTRFGARPVVEGAAVLNLAGLALDGRLGHLLWLFDDDVQRCCVWSAVDDAFGALGGWWGGEVGEAGWSRFAGSGGLGFVRGGDGDFDVGQGLFVDFFFFGGRLALADLIFVREEEARLD